MPVPRMRKEQRDVIKKKLQAAILKEILTATAYAERFGVSVCFVRAAAKQIGIDLPDKEHLMNSDDVRKITYKKPGKKNRWGYTGYV